MGQLYKQFMRRKGDWTSDTPNNPSNDKNSNREQIGNYAAIAGAALGTLNKPYGDFRDQTAAPTKTVMGVIGQTGPVGGVISGVYGVINSIATPIRKNAEEFERGKLKNPKKAGNMAIMGSLLDPIQALSTRIKTKSWGLSTKKYTDALQREASEQWRNTYGVYDDQRKADMQARLLEDPQYSTGIRGAQMYRKGGILPTQTPMAQDGTFHYQLAPQKFKPVVLNTPEYYTKKRNQKLISGTLNTGAAVAPPGASSAFDAAGTLYDITTEGETSPVGILLQNDRKILDKTAQKTTFKTVPGLGRLWNAYEAYQDFSDASKYQDSLNMTKVKKATGGPLTSTFMSKQFTPGGTLTKLSNDTTEVHGQTHAEGGVQLPAQNAEVEKGETIAGDYVFSKELGFAALHKPIAKSLGKIEKKPATVERLNSMRKLNERTEKLKTLQEIVKQKLNLQ